MTAIDYTKPITFRPSDRDREVLELLAEHNPVLAANSADLLRMALQAYLRSDDRFAQMEKTLAIHHSRIDEIAARLAIMVALKDRKVWADNALLSPHEESGG